MSKEYEAADGNYIAGKTALDADKRPEALAALTAAEPLFADLVAKGGTMVAKSRQADASAARDRALSADSEVLSPDSLSKADAALAAADAMLEEGNNKAAIDGYSSVISAYDAVEKRSMAVSVRGRVDELDYGPLDAGNYELAGQKLDAVDNLIEKDPDAAQDNAAEALLRYNIVLAKGWELTAGKRRDEASRYKDESESIKAQVAVKDDYIEAASAWELALKTYESGDHESAAPLFAYSEELFKAVYEKTVAKKSAAEQAMRSASAKSEQSASIATQGDQMLGNNPAVPGADGESGEE